MLMKKVTLNGFNIDMKSHPKVVILLEALISKHHKKDSSLIETIIKEVMSNPQLWKPFVNILNYHEDYTDTDWNGYDDNGTGRMYAHEWHEDHLHPIFPTFPPYPFND
jgi:hypothetical protein